MKKILLIVTVLLTAAIAIITMARQCDYDYMV